MDSKVLDDRGWITKLRRSLPLRATRLLRDASLRFFTRLPSGVKYRVASIFQRRRYPYKLLKEGDCVVQVGSPRDILEGGRSRAIHFAYGVGRTGHVLVVEPDLESVEALQRFLFKHKLTNRVTVVQCGVWSEKGTLKFIVNASHPAANRLVDIANESRNSRGVEDGSEVVMIKVDSLGSILSQYEFQNPKLISITTNGAEREILSGLWSAGKRFAPRFVSLGPPNDANVSIMEEHGYLWIAWDDRGQLFERGNKALGEN